MKLQVTLLLSLSLIVGCDSQSRQKMQTQNQEPVNNKNTNSTEVAQIADKVTVKVDSVKETPIVDVKQEMLIGAWTDGSSENASFGIDKDSIFYVDAFETYHYKMSADSIFIDFIDWTSEIKVTKLTEDSMVWESDMGKSILWRFKD